MDPDALKRIIGGIFSKSLQVRRMLQRDATEMLWLPLAEIVTMAKMLEPAVTPDQLEQAAAGLSQQDWRKPRVELGIQEGFAKWAAGYDEEPNPLITLEEPVVLELLGDAAGKDVLDAGCGTGRYALRLAQAGARVCGLDGCEEMLAVARRKAAEAGLEIDLRLGDVTHLPYPDACFDIAICALTLCHVADIRGAVAELARVLRPGGRLVVSDFHPFCLLIGWRTVFRRQEASYYIENHLHLLQDHVKAVLCSGFCITDVREEVIDERLLPSFAADVVERFRGIPLALILSATKEGKGK
jgi:ubiquinone/menaquinone biosynthesis C-methylase UbiE